MSPSPSTEPSRRRGIAGRALRELALLLTYYVVLTPIALVRRFGRAPIDGRPDPDLPTYWDFLGKRDPEVD